MLSWEFVVRAGLLPEVAVPRPMAVIARGVALLGSSTFWTNWAITLRTWFLAMAVGLLVGLLLGFLAGAIRIFALAVTPTLGYFRAIPPIALFPVALIVFGPGAVPIGIIASITATLTVFPVTAQAAGEAAARYEDLGTVLNCSRLTFLRLFVIPGAMFQTVAASRVAATASFIVTVAGEMLIGGRIGVGASILDASERYVLEEAYWYIALSGVLGLLIDLGFSRVAGIGSRRIEVLVSDPEVAPALK